VSCEVVCNRQENKHESKRISIAGNRNRATTNEDYNRMRLRICYSDLLNVYISECYKYF
jgi:hypothetical protein